MKPTQMIRPSDEWGGLPVYPGRALRGTGDFRAISYPVCPEYLAQQRWVGKLVDLYIALQTPGVSLSDRYADPSAALVHGLQELHQAVEAREAWKFEEKRKADESLAKSRAAAKKG